MLVSKLHSRGVVQCFVNVFHNVELDIHLYEVAFGIFILNFTHVNTYIQLKKNSKSERVGFVQTVPHLA